MNKKLGIFIIILTFIFSFNYYAFSEDMNNGLIYDGKEQIIIKYKDNYNFLGNLKALGLVITNNEEIIDLGNNTKVMNVSSEHKDSMMEELQLDPSIEYVEENYTYTQMSRPNDTHYFNLWHLSNINAQAAWDQINVWNNKVVVAVIDSGIDTMHKDLVNRIAPGGYNYLDNNKLLYDTNGHGTFISGIVSAESNNNYGVSGLAGTSNIKILPIMVIDPSGEATLINLIKAIDYAVNKRVDVINLSLGGTDRSNALKDAIDRAIKANIVVVSASGNDALKGNVINYPASYDGVISVGATNSANKRSAFSNYNKYVDIVAPGENIYSTVTNNRFDYGSGTSFATPMVATTAALLKSINSSLSVNEIRDILTKTALDLGTKGRDNYYGFGLLDMSAAVKKVVKTPIAPIIPVIDEYTDYKLMNVSEDKVFKIQFNYDLLNSSLVDNIYTSNFKNGSIKNKNFKISIDLEDNKVVLLEPITKWTKGLNYFFINDSVIAIDGQKHKSKLRITYYVE